MSQYVVAQPAGAKKARAYGTGKFSMKSLAEKYETTAGVICKIVNRQLWGWLPDK